MKIYLLVVLLISYYEYTSGVPTLEVDANTGHHTISPDIYGMNLVSDKEFAKEIKLPFDRWGGNAVTRYNWKLDISNHASDWFFENIPEDNKNPKALPEGNSADLFIEKDHTIETRTMMTIPLIGWTPKDREKRCGFSVKKYGEQEKTDQWMPDCGNGMKKDGKTKITGNDPHDTSMPITAAFAKEWVQHLVKKFGPASKGGVKFYEMDNEYDLWPGTHRDVKPIGATAAEIVTLTEEYAAAVKEADPSALTLGPVGWGLMSLLQSGGGSADRKNHGNTDFGNYYLKQMKALEAKHGKRLLDYFDCHIYAQTPDQDAFRLRSTRGLWDPTYVDESWIKDLGGDNSKIQFIPRMKKMIAENYPGTKVAITEYNWGAMNTIGGALAQADILGIFGREGVDLAALWGPGKPNEPWSFAFRMFRNYDGKGSEFGDTGVTAKSSDRAQLEIYASIRSHDKHLIVLVINKDANQAIDTKLAINGFAHSGNVKVYTYSPADLSKIVASSATVAGNSVEHKFPAHSLTLFEIAPK